MITIRDDNTVNTLSSILYNKLSEGMSRSELIGCGELRGIGKTSTLIRFARDNNLNMLVKNNITARMLTKEYGYKKIYSINDIRGVGGNFVCDECVDGKDQSLVNVNIITGFTNKYF